MLGTGIDVQVAVQGVAQTIFRKHATDGVFKNALGMAGEELGRCGVALSAEVAGRALGDYVGCSFECSDNLIGIDNDDVVTAVDMRGVARFGLAAQDVGHTGSQTAYGLILGINEHPFLLNGLLVG